MIQGRMVNNEEMMKGAKNEKEPSRGRRESIAQILHQNFIPLKGSEFSSNKIRRASSMLIDLCTLTCYS